MDQTRHTEYKDFVNDAYDYPEGLNHMHSRLHKRIRQRLAKRIIKNIGIFAGVFILFTMAVNRSDAFAQVVSQIPVISNLAEYVKSHISN